jgi:hypothetical protein
VVPPVLHRYHCGTSTRGQSRLILAVDHWRPIFLYVFSCLNYKQSMDRHYTDGKIRSEYLRTFGRFVCNPVSPATISFVNNKFNRDRIQKQQISLSPCKSTLSVLAGFLNRLSRHRVPTIKQFVLITFTNNSFFCNLVHEQQTLSRQKS